jgi:hypothetical protein
MEMKPLAVKAKEARRLLGGISLATFYKMLPELESFLEGRIRMPGSISHLLC